MFDFMNIESNGNQVAHEELYLASMDRWLSMTPMKEVLIYKEVINPSQMRFFSIGWANQ
jgi:hypothetical protein